MDKNEALLGQPTKTQQSKSRKLALAAAVFGVVAIAGVVGVNYANSFGRARQIDARYDVSGDQATQDSEGFKFAGITVNTDGGNTEVSIGKNKGVDVLNGNNGTSVALGGTAGVDVTKSSNGTIYGEIDNGLITGSDTDGTINANVDGATGTMTDDGNGGKNFGVNIGGVTIDGNYNKGKIYQVHDPRFVCLSSTLSSTASQLAYGGQSPVAYTDYCGYFTSSLSSGQVDVDSLISEIRGNASPTLVVSADNVVGYGHKLSSAEQGQYSAGDFICNLDALNFLDSDVNRAISVASISAPNYESLCPNGKSQAVLDAFYHGASFVSAKSSNWYSGFCKC